MESFENKAESNTGNYLDFTDICLNRLGMQTQYAKRYALGLLGYGNLGEGLRFQTKKIGGETEIIGIHPDDIKEFIQRVQKLKGNKI
ncbi:MAG: hypothetical protein WCT08_01645 [Patescibacteria group bacterium]|jgi:hypothetical protein